MRFNSIQLRVPEAGVAEDPLRHILQWFSGKRKCVVPAAPGPPNQSRPLQNSNVLAKSSERHGERLRDVSDRCRAADEPVHNRTTSGIRDGSDYGVKWRRSQILNHLVQYKAERIFVNPLRPEISIKLR